MNFKQLILLLLALIFGMTSCSDEEYAGSKITSAHLADMESIILMKLPPGTKGLHYYLGNGRDPSLWAKLLIPADQKNLLLSDPIFGSSGKKLATKGANNFGHFDWWKPDDLKSSAIYEKEANRGTTYIILGEEHGNLIMYISWDSL